MPARALAVSPRIATAVRLRVAGSGVQEAPDGDSGRPPHTLVRLGLATAPPRAGLTPVLTPSSTWHPVRETPPPGRGRALIMTPPAPRARRATLLTAAVLLLVQTARAQSPSASVEPLAPTSSAALTSTPTAIAIATTTGATVNSTPTESPLESSTCYLRAPVVGTLSGVAGTSGSYTLASNGSFPLFSFSCSTGEGMNGANARHVLVLHLRAQVLR